MSKQIEELRALKDRRSRNREVRDFEERILLDNLEETERMLNGTPINTHRKKFPLSKHEDLRTLQVEYERMREEEKRQCQDVGGPRRRRQSNRSDESMSIHLIRDRSKYNPNNDPKLQSLAANHGKQMEFLSNRNKDLERQRDEIRRRLGDLGKKPADTDNTSALLAELRDQEARNQKLLDELKKQLLASRQPVAIIGEQQVQQKKTYTYPVYYGNSLVAEISAIRQAYIQSGGNDPEILAQLAQMLAEAQAIEEAMRNKRPPEPKKKEKKTTEITSHVMTMDMENERLNRELLLLQEQNLMARNRRKDDREDELERELRRLQQEHLMKMYELQQNMEALRQDTIIDRTRLQLELNTQQQQAQPQSIVIHQPQCPPNIQHTHVEKGCYDHHQCRCSQRCPPPPKPPEPPPPAPYIPLQLPPPPPIRVEEPPPRKKGGRGGGGYSWYVEEYIPPQVIEEGAEVKLPKEGYKIERRFPSGGGPPIEIVSRGQGGPPPGPPGPRGPPGPGFRLPSQMRPRPGPGDRMVSRSNEVWNRPIPGVDEGVQFDHD